MTQQLYIKTDGPIPEGCDYITAGKVYKAHQYYGHACWITDDTNVSICVLVGSRCLHIRATWHFCDQHGNPVPAPWEGERDGPDYGAGTQSEINYRAPAEALAEALELARIDLKEWLKSFPNASREPTVKTIERIDAALAAFDHARQIEEES